MKEARAAANLQSSQKIPISRACKTKLGRVLPILENTILKQIPAEGRPVDGIITNMYPVFLAVDQRMPIIF